MLSSFLILFREAVEVSLVVGIVLGFLSRTGQKTAVRFVWAGVAAGLVVSVAAAVLFAILVGEFEGTAEQIFEGTAMAAAALLLFPVLSWLSHQNTTSKQITGSFEGKSSGLLHTEVFLVILASVARDGVECVLFLGASSPTAPENNLVGGLAGLAAAAVLGWLLFSGSKKVQLKPFFVVTNTLLILLGAGLASRALGEFGEAGWVPGIIGPLWDLNPAPLADGSLAWWHEDGAVGGLFKSLFGYVGAPSLTQILGYLAYLGAALFLVRKPAKTSP